ncbi:MAG: hypothetical protein FJX76_06190 [Armatimonadetes bacterium]|nr:hypothetical protein [Armatimonadota bacterium]
MTRICSLLLVALLLAVAPAHAQYDGLTLLGAGDPFRDESGATLTLYGFKTKYQEPIVGFYFTKGDTQVRFYANAATWDKLKQLFIKTRDQWATIGATDFAMMGSVKSYRIANKTSIMRVSIEGSNPLQGKQLLISAMGGPSQIERVFVDMDQQNVAGFVEQLYRVDGYLKGAGGQ